MNFFLILFLTADLFFGILQCLKKIFKYKSYVTILSNNLRSLVVIFKANSYIKILN